MAHIVGRMAHIDARIGAILSDQLAKLGWSQRELSRRSSVPETTLRNGLHGTRPFRIPDLLATCAALGLKMGDVLAQAEQADAA